MATQPLPKPQEDADADPPLVALVREKLRDTRIGAFVKRHRTLAAALAGILVILKSWKWLVFDVLHHRGWLLDHWPVVLGVLGAVFLVVFAGVRLGIGWFDDDEDEDEAVLALQRRERGLERARDAATIRR